MNNYYEIFINHNDWHGTCQLDKETNIIMRKIENDLYDKGSYEIIYNKLIIKWEKWTEEIFFSNNHKNNIYYSENLFNKIGNNIFILDNINKFLVILNRNNDKFIIWENNICGNYSINENELSLNVKNSISKKYLKINEYLFYNKNIENHFFEIDLKIEDLSNKYILNKLNKSFINSNNIDEYGTYKIKNNIINFKWHNKEENYYFDTLLKIDNLIESNNSFTIINPNKFIINNKLFFSNISLCKNRIILTSIYYRYEPYDIKSLNINLIGNSNKIIKKIIWENNDFEASFNIILELSKIENNVSLELSYLDYKKIFFLEQMYIIEHKISAMTLFKDDYELLEKYLDYYSNLGIEVFFLYYNDKINQILVNYLNQLNKVNKYKIYLIEWDFIYWWKISDSEKQHFAQTMAINDSLNILKNYGNYILYNDLDEYFIMDNKCYPNFNEIIDKNPDIDIFIYKNQFCKMGNGLIKYKDFYKRYDENIIILGNYWDNGREKNLIKSKKINVMGVHKYFPKFNIDSEIKSMKINNFYHFINFEEKYREKYMTEYIE